MSSYAWAIQADGRYVIDTLIGGTAVRTMVDTGLVWLIRPGPSRLNFNRPCLINSCQPGN